MIKELQRTRPDYLKQIFSETDTNTAVAPWSELLVPESQLFNYIEKSYKEKMVRD